MLLISFVINFTSTNIILLSYLSKNYITIVLNTVCNDHYVKKIHTRGNSKCPRGPYRSESKGQKVYSLNFSLSNTDGPRSVHRPNTKVRKHTR